MKICVLVKIVDGELNPFDACALELALSLEQSEVTVLSMAPVTASGILRELTRLGVKRVILLSDTTYAGSDTLATSRILSTALKQIEYDLILCGRQSIDGDTAQVGVEVASLSNIPYITSAMSLSVTGSTVKCTTRSAQAEKALPALVTVERINVLRRPSIRSKAGEIEIWDNRRLKIPNELCGLAGSPTRVIQTYKNECGKRKCRFIKAEDFRSVLESLTARTIKYNSDITQKSGRVCVVGDMTAEQIHFIADNYEKLPFSSPDEIAEKVKRINPDILLFPATAEGRETAPAVAAKLECGLCADCTGIEYDGEKMIMYRPAKGGDIIAKIVCNTRPQMATVRVNTDSVKNIIGVGMGASGRLAEIKELASALCAEICASRAAVDNGILPYECQVGLTGKQISPHIYIALGISGQIQHISGIMNAGYIIAVNSDKNARIFDYADFGIVSDISDFLANSKYKININGRK